jgi:hypothetical protein
MEKLVPIPTIVAIDDICGRYSLDGDENVLALVRPSASLRDP